MFAVVTFKDADNHDEETVKADGAVHVVDADKGTLPLATVCTTVQGEEIHNEHRVAKT